MGLLSAGHRIGNAWLHTSARAVEFNAKQCRIIREYGAIAKRWLIGCRGYWLARRWIQSPWLCLLAGFVFAYSPFKLQRLTQHFNLQFTATIPVYILVFMRAFEFPEGQFLPRVRSWYAVAGCFVLGLFTVLNDYYVLFGMLYFSLAYASWYWLRLGQMRWRAGRT
ncbi:hypothetical protein [Hymenobacter arizonensis]|uniref:hypothetical protein n=1 Tax=Hymenobacter arizonensis TaxID=1227077 RepID=UPI000B884521|nr:hypothetical protein [Hymenobacter arizonensis]